MCAPSEDSDQPGHSPRLIRVFTVCMNKAWLHSYPMSAQWKLIRLGGCPGWSKSSLGAHVILLILSWAGSNHLFRTVNTWAASSKNVSSNMHKLCRFRSSCTCEKYQSCSPFIYSVEFKGSVGWQSPDQTAHPRSDLGLHVSICPVGTYFASWSSYNNAWAQLFKASSA